MRTRATSTTFGAVLRRLVLTSLLGVAMAMIAMPGLAAAADPSATPDPSAPIPTPSPTIDPTLDPTPPPTPDPTPTPSPERTSAPEAAPAPTPDPTPAPAPSPTAPPPPLAPRSMNVFVAAGFRFQDPNLYACTSASVRTMLNLVAMGSVGGDRFRWTPTNSGAVRDSILAWERKHDTLPGGYGSDPHGWRNALNFYGWGPAALWAGARVYDDYSYTSYDSAMKATVRALMATGKPVGILARRGEHAQMITGFYGLIGDPFTKDGTGAYLNTFTVSGFYLTDPLRSANAVNKPISYLALARTPTYKWRFQRYYETDSRFDDPYTPGYRVSKMEWYSLWVVILPVR